MAVNAATGGKHKPQKQSGLGGLASSLLGGGGSHGSGGHSGGSGGIAGQLVGSLLGGGKPQHSGAGGGHGGSSSGASQQGGLLGMASSFLGGNQGGGHQSSSVRYVFKMFPVSTHSDRPRIVTTAIHPPDQHPVLLDIWVKLPRRHINHRTNKVQPSMGHQAGNTIHRTQAIRLQATRLHRLTVKAGRVHTGNLVKAIHPLKEGMGIQTLHH